MTRLALLALFAAAAASADELPIDVVGFSPDGRYAAYIEHGVGEGTGYPWASLVIYDVAKSVTAGAPVKITLESGKEGDTEDVAVAQARKAADGEAKRLGFEAWEKAQPVKHDEHGRIDEESGAPIGNLELKTKKAAGKQRAQKCTEPFQPLLVELRMFFMDDETPVKVALEKKVPKDRPCVIGCELDQVWAHEKSTLIFVRCGAQGFEGPSSKIAPFTAILPSSLIRSTSP